jgi:hypothetical protein
MLASDPPECRFTALARGFSESEPDLSDPKRANSNELCGCSEPGRRIPGGPRSSSTPEREFLTPPRPFTTAKRPFTTAKRPFTSAKRPLTTAMWSFSSATRPFTTATRSFTGGKGSFTVRSAPAALPHLP